MNTMREDFEAWATSNGLLLVAHACSGYEQDSTQLAWMAWRAARQPVADQHPDDVAVDAFAASMKAKMAHARTKGRGGWEDPAQCSADDQSRLLRDHVEKGDPRDVANFCMMLHQRGEAIARQPVGEVVAWYWPFSGAVCSAEAVSRDRAPADNAVALYAAPPQQPERVNLSEFKPRIEAAIDRIVNHQCLMRVPVDDTDPDIVLSDILKLINQQESKS